MGRPQRRYKLVRVIGRGAAGTIYLAIDHATGEEIALKHLSDDAVTKSANARARFKREIRILSRCRHPNLVRFLGHGRSGGRPYFTMELVRGPTLAEQLARGPIPIAASLRIAHGIARGLDYVHRLGVVHRDVKPSNILLEQNRDGRATPRLVDFGLARFDEEQDLNITSLGVAVGTPRFTSPEQARGSSRDADPRSDIYSLGLVLAASITHKVPPAPRSMDDLRLRFARDLEPELVRCAAPAVVDLCRRALQFDPRLRHRTARDFAREIRGLLVESSQRVACVTSL